MGIQIEVELGVINLIVFRKLVIKLFNSLTRFHQIH